MFVYLLFFVHSVTWMTYSIGVVVTAVVAVCTAHRTLNLRLNGLLVVKAVLWTHMNVTWQPKLTIDPEKNMKPQSIFGCHWNLCCSIILYIIWSPVLLRILFYFAWLLLFSVFYDCIPGLLHSNESITSICMDVL